MQKRGLLESADGGTVFLDEISEMVPSLQAKLLRFLEEKSFKRVGGAPDIRVDVRVIARPTGSWTRKSQKGASAATCSTASTFCRSRCRRCAITARTSLLAEFYIDDV